MIRGQAWTTGLAAGLVVGVTLMGCGASGTNRNVSRAAPAAPTGSASGSAHPRTPALPPPPVVPTLPNRCANVLTTAELNTILGRRLSGTTQLIRGVAEPAIGRIGRVTCRYGITATAAGRPTAGRVPATTTPGGPSPIPPATASPAAGQPAAGGVPIEIGLSTYRDPDSASQRINFTIHDQEAKGAVATDATILDLDGVLLTSANMAMLALSYGSLTLALSIDPRVVPTGQVGRVAAAIGKAVLRNLSDNGDSSGDLGGELGGGPSGGGRPGASTGVPE